MTCHKSRLVVKVKSGEVRSLGFTIKSKTELIQEDDTYFIPMDLSNYTIEFQIKDYPYYTVDPIIDKEITTTEGVNDGYIYEPTEGKFRVNITQDDMNILIPEKEYYLIITLVNGDTRIIISGEGDKSGIFMVCKS